MQVTDKQLVTVSQTIINRCECKETQRSGRFCVHTTTQRVRARGGAHAVEQRRVRESRALWRRNSSPLLAVGNNIPCFIIAN